MSDSSADEERAESSEGDAALRTDGGEEDGETDVVTVDLDSLEVDVLGLRIDVDDLELDVSARPGDGNLVGNLLSAVAGLLDDGLSALLGGLELNVGERLSSAFESARASIGDAVDEVPIGELLTPAVVGVVSQVLGLDDLLGDDETEKKDGETDEDSESADSENGGDETENEADEEDE